MKQIVVLLLAATLAACAGIEPKGRALWSFGVIGDTPLTAGEEVALGRVIDEMNREDLAFVVHVGDIKSGGSRCSDELFEQRKALLQRIRHPFVYTPGDNEWTDCHRASAGGYDPLERLSTLRRLFHSGEQSLGGRTMALERQSRDARFAEYRENARWSFGGVLFVSINVPGSNNNLGRTAQMDAEYRRRMTADLAWLDDAFRIASERNLGAVVIFTQANPGWDLLGMLRLGRPDGYTELRAALAAHALRFGKPVLFVHGDTHHYRVDHPLVDPSTGERVGNFTRLESFGSPRTDWVRVTVLDSKEQPFFIRPGSARP